MKTCNECLNPHYAKGKCKVHYRMPSQLKPIKKKSIAKPVLIKAKKERSITLGKWFNDQISTMPRSCENCGDYLSPYIHISQRAYIAHIVPKRHFESVMTHPLNRIFLCVDCHSKFDNCLSKEVVSMKVWPIAVERFKNILPEIDKDEICHLRPCFEDVARLIA